MFFTIEGIEGSGKSTITVELEKRLIKRGIDALRTSEPRGNNSILRELGEQITKIIQRTDIDGLSEFFLFSAFRNEHVSRFIKPSLKNNKIVICDRFIHSSIVYQGIVKGVSLNLIDMVNENILEGLIIDQVFLIDLDPEIASKRLNRREKIGDKFDKEDKKFHNKIREGYLEIFKNNEAVTIIDGDRKLDLIVTEIESKIMEILNGQ